MRTSFLPSCSIAHRLLLLVHTIAHMVRYSWELASEFALAPGHTHAEKRRSLVTAQSRLHHASLFGRWFVGGTSTNSSQGHSRRDPRWFDLAGRKPSIMRTGSVLAGLLCAGAASSLHAFTIPSATRLAVPASALDAVRSEDCVALQCYALEVLWRCFGCMLSASPNANSLPSASFVLLSSRCWLLSLSAFAFPGKAGRCEMATQPRAQQHVVKPGAADQAR